MPKRYGRDFRRAICERLVAGERVTEAPRPNLDDTVKNCGESALAHLQSPVKVVGPSSEVPPSCSGSDTFKATEGRGWRNNQSRPRWMRTSRPYTRASGRRAPLFRHLRVVEEGSITPSEDSARAMAMRRPKL
jgi:hypothetical protein